MSERLGTYTDGTPILYRDFVRTHKEEVLNVLEACEGGLVCATLDDLGDHSWMDVGSYENYCLDFVARWDDPNIFMASYI